MAPVDLTDYGEMLGMARAAAGIFPRVEVAPEHVVELIEALSDACKENDRLRGVILRDGGFTEEQIARILEKP